MVPDPYKTLELDHNATPSLIKKSYRRLALRYHPDRLVARVASEKEFKIASKRFAEISTAYQLLSDERRKRQYDHIYKYGGFDEDDKSETVLRPSTKWDPNQSHSKSKKRSTGIGYSMSDPISYFFPNHSKCGHKTVAGIQIPSRIHLANPPPQGGLSFAFSSGKFTTNESGSKKFTSKTTQFFQGKRFSRKETTTLHPDGRKEIVIEGDNCVKRRWTSPPKTKVVPEGNDATDDARSINKQPERPDEPWYVEAWKGVRERMNMCFNPCGEIMVQ